MAGTADLGTLVLRLTADNRSFDASLLSSMARAAGFAAGVVSSVTAVGAVAVKATKAYADFEDSMTKSLSIMSDADKGFRTQMEQTAIQLSTKSTQSAVALAKGYYYLASAGLDAERSMKALSVANNFAIAGDMDLEKATESLTDSVTNLGLATKDATEYQKNMIRVSDVLVKAGADSNASTEQLATSLRTKAGAALRTYNKDLEEGVAVLEAFGNQGIKAENAGESLNIVIRDLARTSLNNGAAWQQFGVSVFDAQGNMRNLGQIISEVEDRFSALSPKQQKSQLEMLGFQDRTVSAFNALIGMGREITKFEGDLRDAGGTAEKVANSQLNSLTGQFKILGNIIDTIMIQLGQAWAPEMRAVIEVMQNLALSVSSSSDEFDKLGKNGGQILIGMSQAAVVAVASLGVLYNTLKMIAAAAGYLGGYLTEQVNNIRLSDIDSLMQAYEGRLTRAAEAAVDARQKGDEAALKSAQIEGATMTQYINDLQKERNEIQANIAVAQEFKDIMGKHAGDSMGSIIDISTKASDIVTQLAVAGERNRKAAEEKAAAERDAATSMKKQADAAKQLVEWNKAMTEQADENKAAVRKRQSYASQDVTANDSSVYSAYNALDPYKAASVSIQSMRQALATANDALEENKGLLAQGYIGLDEYTRNLEKQKFVIDNYATVLGSLNSKGDLKDFWETGTESLAKYNTQFELSKRIQDQYKADLDAQRLSQKDYDALIAKTTISLDAYQRKRAEIIAQQMPSLGQNAGRDGFSLAASPGQAGYDATRFQNTGISDVDSMGANAIQQQQLEQKQADELKALEKFYAEKGKLDEKYEIAKNAMITSYEERRRNLQLQQASMALGAAESIGDSLTSIAADTAGKQSAFYKVSFAMSKAFAIADASVKIAQGIAAAAANPFPMNLAAMASVAAATASIVSNIMSVRMTSFDGGGMTPGGNRTGGIDGKGGMLSVLHPNEMVVDLQKPSNRNQGMGGGDVNIVVNNSAGADVQVTESSDERDNRIINIAVNRSVKQVEDNINTGRGGIPGAMERRYGLSRGRGQ